MITTAKILGYDGERLLLMPEIKVERELLRKQADSVEIRICDGRQISNQQRKKVYALFRDISVYTGYVPEEVKEVMKYDYISKTGAPEFSLSDCDMTTARMFIDHLVEFCLIHDIPCQDTLLNLAEDVGKYLYLCLVHRKCCLCGKRAHVHHADRLGMGADRKEMCHEGYEAMALCWKHHKEAHSMGKQEFNNLYHIFGIKLDDTLCRILKLGRYAKNVTK